MIEVVNKYKFDPTDKISFYIGRGSALLNMSKMLVYIMKING